MQHPDEGTIHAWLDGALPADEARAFEEHIAGCAACAAAVAEARGLLAASSRILSALDSVPGGVLPAADPEASGIASMKAARAHAPRWRSTPWRAAAAIVLVGSVSWLATHTTAQKDNIPAQIAVASDNAGAPSDGRDTAAHPRGVDLSSGAESGRDAAAARVPSIVTPVPPNAPAPNRTAARVLAQSQAGKAVVVAPSPSAGGASERRPGSRTETLATAAPPMAGMVAGAAAASTGAATGAGTATLPNADRVNDQARREEKAMGSAAARNKTAATGAVMLERARAAEQSVAMQSAASAMATTAPMATLMPGGERQRFVGCYTIESSGSTSAGERDESNSLQLPGRIELRAERAGLAAGSSQLVVRPLPGAPAFAAGITGTWEMTAGDAIRIAIGEGKTRVEALLTVAGDSVSGVSSDAAGRKGIVKGKRGCGG